MTIRFPRPLAPGDLIALPAPSAGVPELLHPRLDRAIAALRKQGYRVVEGDCLRQGATSARATREARASELMAFLVDPDVAAIMPPWGGDLAIELLPLLDFHHLKQVSPKWFSGFSDLSTLQLPLATIAGWASLHGPNLMQLGSSTLDATTAAIWGVLSLPPDTPFLQSASLRHPNQQAASPTGSADIWAETQWRPLDGTRADISLTGRLIGGCLDTLSRLAGTVFGAVPRYIEASRPDGTLLYLENAEMKPYDLARALLSLRMAGWFDGLSGVLLGRSGVSEPAQRDEFAYIDALRTALGDLPCPVIHDMDIGHIPPQMSLVNGAFAQVELRRGRGTVVQWLKNSH
ncbi:MAG: S66 family peptidase [Janthinobacterium lividum]